MNFPSINIQGNIISSEIIEKIRSEDIKYQQPSDFKLDKKNSVRDEIGFAWAAIRAHYTAFKIRAERLAEGESGVTSTRNSWMVPFFQELGYTLQFKPGAEQINLKSYHISHRAGNLNDFPVHIMGINDDLDKRRENGGPRLSPHALMQEFLNNTDHTYALVTNGRYLRLLRDATRLVRLSYLEFDLEKMMEEELYADFAILFRLLHATRMPQHPDNLEKSIIEYYHQESLASGSRIREKLSVAVESSIKLLANGFLIHPANTLLREEIQQKRLSSEGYYLLQLRLIYRFLFLIVTEERNLVYLDTKDPEVQRKRKVYYDFYSIERLRKLATRLHFVDGRKHDLWEGLKTTFQLFERSTVGENLGIKPLGSGLFSPAALGLLPELKLSNETLLKVIRHLTLFENEQMNWVRVNYSDLDVEEFGSVYEGLLEYDAVFTESNGQPVFSFVEGKGRSSSGSHYTPEELVKPLIKHSLEYIIEDKLKQKNKEEALLSIKVCDVACGSGHILLSAARKIATELACIRESLDSKADVQQPSPKYFRKAIRDVIKHCIYGVDKNPLAVELCKVALWLEAHNPGEPLGFLDHHIKCGDAIVGLAQREELDNGIADEAFKTLPGDDKEIANSYLKQNKSERKERETTGTQLKAEFDASVQGNVQEAMEEYGDFIKLPERTPEEIEAKQRSYNKFLNGKGYTFLKTMADTQVAQFFIPKTSANKDRLVNDAEFRQILRGYKSWQSQKTSYSVVIGQYQRFFHWFIEFPEVFQKGGFNCIIGNPPYLGAQKVTELLGDRVFSYLKEWYQVGGLADLVVYFIFRISDLLENGNGFSILTTSSINKGDSHKLGLKVLVDKNSLILNYVVRKRKWPGKASTHIAMLSGFKGYFSGVKYLDDKIVEAISSDFESISKGETTMPFELKMNEESSYIGSNFNGEGFIVEEAFVKNCLSKDEGYKEVLFKNLNGKEFNTSPTLKSHSYIINFKNFTEEQAKLYPICYNHLKETVYPERQLNKEKKLREKWWIYERTRDELYNAIGGNQRVLIRTQASKHNVFEFVPNEYIFNQKVVVFSFETFAHYATLNSSIHEIWFWRYSGDLGGTTLNYSPKISFYTFPIPTKLGPLNKIGESYHSLRRNIMAEINLGLTKTYNLFHSQHLTSVDIEKQSKQPREVCVKTHLDILKLRELHAQMDQAVLEAYGWQDIQLRHDFYEVEYLPENDRVRYTIHPEARKEILKRLLELNHKIHEEEVKAGLWDKKKPAKPKKKELKPVMDLQQSLFSDKFEEMVEFDLDTGIYTTRDAADITGISIDKIRRWFKELSDSSYEGIEGDSNLGADRLKISFHGLIELVVIGTLRENKFSLQKILKARTDLKNRTKTSYPFATKHIKKIDAAGSSIVFVAPKGTITLDGTGQYNLEIIREFFRHIEFNTAGLAERLFPSKGKGKIVVDPKVAEGKPSINGKSVWAEVVAKMYTGKESLPLLQEQYDLDKEEILAAVEYCTQ